MIYLPNSANNTDWNAFRYEHIHYEEFKEQFISAVKESLYEQGSDMNVSVNEVKKLNESYEAMTVTPKGARVGVNIGLAKFYKAYRNSKQYHWGDSKQAISLRSTQIERSG